MRFCFTKRERVRKSRDFRKIYESGSYVSNRILVMHVIVNADAQTRVGITAGKKIGGAVFRNRCKRRVRECCRLFRTELPQGFDIVVACRKGVAESSWEETVRLFKDVCTRMKDRIERTERRYR